MPELSPIKMPRKLVFASDKSSSLLTAPAVFLAYRAKGTAVNCVVPISIKPLPVFIFTFKKWASLPQSIPAKIPLTTVPAPMLVIIIPLASVVGLCVSV